MKTIQILDCTLRDGGHIVDGYFGENKITHIIQKLIDSNVDIIEVGFLTEEHYSTDYARFKTISDVKRILPKEKKQSKYALMADNVDLSELEPYDGTIEYIRLSFKRFRLEWAINTAKILNKKGYKVIINPVNCNVYSDEEYINVIKKINNIHPYGFSIVDTFGVLRLRDLSRLYYLVDANLLPDIHIGIHLHENLGLAYSLAQHFISINENKRNIIIDGSLLGMGRVPGNLSIEQIMDHLNLFYGKDYKLQPALDAIDDCISHLKKNKPWGYSTPYFLSAKHRLHRTYAEFLVNKWKIRTSDIEKILSMVELTEAEMFNESYIENLYRKYVSIPYDDSSTRQNLSKSLYGKSILIIAPGPSIINNQDSIKKYIDDINPLIISIHFTPKFVNPDYVFYTNIKRFEMDRNEENRLITSNLLRYKTEIEGSLILDYASLAYHDGEYNDDSTLMLLNFLNSIGVKKIAIAGFDGFSSDNSSFFKDEYDRNTDPNLKTSNVKKIYRKCYSSMNNNFITHSEYE